MKTEYNFSDTHSWGPAKNLAQPKPVATSGINSKSISLQSSRKCRIHTVNGTTFQQFIQQQMNSSRKEPSQKNSPTAQHTETGFFLSRHIFIKYLKIQINYPDSVSSRDNLLGVLPRQSRPFRSGSGSDKCD